jgi:hypothetical protein
MNSMDDAVRLDEQDLRFIDATITALDDPDSDNRHEPVVK